MNRWWERIGEVELGDYTKEEVEDLTGRIPLFLEKCVIQLVRGKKIKLDTEFFANVDSQARACEREIQSRCSQSQLREYLFYLYNFANIFSHYEYMRSCISNRPVLLSSKNIPDLIDHRYFYNKYDPEAEQQVGYSPCGLSRNVVAKMLLASDVFFGDRLLKVITPVGQYINNPSVTRFMMELAVLSSIASTGLKLPVLS